MIFKANSMHLAQPGWPRQCSDTLVVLCRRPHCGSISVYRGGSGSCGKWRNSPAWGFCHTGRRSPTNSKQMVRCPSGGPIGSPHSAASHSCAIKLRAHWQPPASGSSCRDERTQWEQFRSVQVPALSRVPSLLPSGSSTSIHCLRVYRLVPVMELCVEQVDMSISHVAVSGAGCCHQSRLMACRHTGCASLQWCS